MFLVTTSVREFWDSEDTLLFLGPWCTPYNRKEDWAHRIHLRLSNPWDNRSKLNSAAVYCERVLDDLLEELTEYMNVVHGKRYQSRYWRILVGPWLMYYIHGMYDRYIHVKTALDEHSPIRTLCLSEAEFITPRGMHHYATLLDEDRYNLQLFSMICSGLGVRCSFRNYPPGETDRSRNDDRGKWPKLIESWGQSICKKVKTCLYSTSDSICVRQRRHIIIAHSSINLVQQMSWNVLPRGNIGIVHNWIKEDAKFKATFCSKRQGLAHLKAYDEFTRLLISTLPVSFPTLYLEGYASAREQALHGWPYVPKVCMASNAWYYPDNFKFLLAEWGEKKCRLVGFQHGGGYGTWKYVAPERHELNICDRFYSWGWSSQEPTGRVRDLPAPQLSEANDNPIKLPNAFSKILLVATCFTTHPYRLDSYPQSYQVEEYIQWRIRFVNALRGDSRSNLLVRLASYDKDSGWCQGDRLRDGCGQVQFDDLGNSLLFQLRHTRLAVFDHPTTAHLEALAFNIPCILFWHPNHWELREQAAPFYKELSDCGILHDDPEKAAAKVMEVYENPSSWWESEPAQNARRSFVRRYALGRKDWMDSWIHALEEEAALSQAACQ